MTIQTIPSDGAGAGPASRPFKMLGMLALLVGIAAVLYYVLQRQSLWEDEIIALTHTFQPLPSFFVGVLRNDIHPFFYFLVLKAWMLPAPASGTWALASSLAFTGLSALVLYRVSRNMDGKHAALWSVALYLLLPTTAWAAGNLRMYALLPAMVVGVWYLNQRFLRAPSPSKAWALVLLQLCTAYIHAIEFIFLAFIVLSVLIEHARSAPPKTLRTWLALQVGAGILMLPLPMSALIRGTEPLPPSKLISFFTTFGQVVAGIGGGEYRVLLLAGLAVFIVLVYFATRNRLWRTRTLLLPVGVLLITVLIGFLGKPIFKSPVFTANLLPFLALGAGAGIASVLQKGSKFHASLVAVFVLALAAGTMPWSAKLLPQENYQAAANYLKNNVAPGDVVVVPHLSVYWGVMLYSTNSAWGEPLAVRPPDNPQWQKITQKLGAARSAAVGLIPGLPYVDVQGVRYCTGTQAADCTRGAARVWIVDRRTYNNGVNLAGAMKAVQTAYFARELAVTRLQPDAGGTTTFANPYLVMDKDAQP